MTLKVLNNKFKWNNSHKNNILYQAICKGNTVHNDESELLPSVHNCCYSKRNKRKMFSFHRRLLDECLQSIHLPQFRNVHISEEFLAFVFQQAQQIDTSSVLSNPDWYYQIQLCHISNALKVFYKKSCVLDYPKLGIGHILLESLNR